MDEQGDNQNHGDLLKKILQPNFFNQVEAHYLSLVIEVANTNSINALLTPSIDLSNGQTHSDLKNETNNLSKQIAHKIVINYFQKHNMIHSLNSLKNEIPNTEHFYLHNEHLINTLQYNSNQSIIHHLMNQRNFSTGNEEKNFKSTRNQISTKLLQVTNNDDDNIQPLRNFLNQSLSNQNKNLDPSEFYMKSSFSHHDTDIDEPNSFHRNINNDNPTSFSMNLSEMPPQGVSESKWNANLVTTVKNINNDLNEPESSQLKSLPLDPNAFRVNSIQSSDISNLIPNDASMNEWKRRRLQSINSAFPQNHVPQTSQNSNSMINSSFIKAGLNDDSLETDTSLVLPDNYTASTWKEAKLQNITDKEAFLHSSSSFSLETESGFNVQNVIADLEGENGPSSKLSFEGWSDNINDAIKVAADEGDKIRSTSIKPMTFLSSSSSNKPPKMRKAPQNESSISSINLSSMEIDLDSSMNMEQKELEAVRNLEKNKNNKLNSSKKKKKMKNGSFSSSSTMNKIFDSNQPSSSKTSSDLNSIDSTPKKQAPSLLDSDEYQRKKEELKKNLLANRKFTSHTTDSDIDSNNTINNEEEDDKSSISNKSKDRKLSTSNKSKDDKSSTSNELKDDKLSTSSELNTNKSEIINTQTTDDKLPTNDEEEEEESNELLENEYSDELNMLSVDDETNNEEEQDGKESGFMTPLEHLSSTSTSSSGRLKNVILASSDSEQKDDDKSSSSSNSISPKLIVNSNFQFEIPQNNDFSSSSSENIPSLNNPGEITPQKKRLKRVRVKVKSSKKQKDDTEDTEDEVVDKPKKKFRDDQNNSAIQILNGTYDFEKSKHNLDFEEIGQGSQFDLDIDDGKFGFEIPQKEEEEETNEENNQPQPESSSTIEQPPKRKHSILPKNNIEFLTSSSEDNHQAILELPSEKDMIKVPFIRKNDSLTQTATENYLSPSKRKTIKVKKKKPIEEEDSFSTDILSSSIIDQPSDSSIILKKRELKVYDFETLVKSIPEKQQPIVEEVQEVQEEEEEEHHEPANEGFVFEIPENPDFEEEINEPISKSETESTKQNLNTVNENKKHKSKSETEVDVSNKHNKIKKIKVRKHHPSAIESPKPIANNQTQTNKEDLLSESSDSDNDQHNNLNTTPQKQQQNTPKNTSKINNDIKTIQQKSNNDQQLTNKVNLKNRKLNDNLEDKQIDQKNELSPRQMKPNKKIAYTSPRLAETLNGSDSEIISDNKSQSKKKKIKIKKPKRYNETESSFSAEFDRMSDSPELKEIGVQNEIPKPQTKVIQQKPRNRKEIKIQNTPNEKPKEKPVKVNIEIQTIDNDENSFEEPFDSILDNDDIEESEVEPIEENIPETKTEDTTPTKIKRPDYTFSELMEIIKNEEKNKKQIDPIPEPQSSIIDESILNKESSQMNNQIEEVISEIINSNDTKQKEIDLTYSYISSENDTPKTAEHQEKIDKNVQHIEDIQEEENLDEIISSSEKVEDENQSNEINQSEPELNPLKEIEKVSFNENNDLNNIVIEEEEEDNSNIEEEPSSIMMQIKSIPNKSSKKSDSDSDSELLLNEQHQSSEGENQVQLELPQEYSNQINDEPSSIIFELPNTDDKNQIDDNEDSILGPANEFKQVNKPNKQPTDELKQKQGTLELPKQDEFQKIKKVVVQSSSSSSESDNENPNPIPLSPRNPYGSLTPKQIPIVKPVVKQEIEKKEEIVQNDSDSSDDQVNSEFIPLSPKNPYPGIRKNDKIPNSINQNDSSSHSEEENQLKDNPNEKENNQIEDESTINDMDESTVNNEESSQIRQTVKFILNPIQSNEMADVYESDFSIPSEIQNSSEIIERNQIPNSPSKAKKAFTFEELMEQIETIERQEKEPNPTVEQQNISSESNTEIENDEHIDDDVPVDTKRYFKSNKVHTGDSIISFISCGDSQFDYSQDHSVQSKPVQNSPKEVQISHIELKRSPKKQSSANSPKSNQPRNPTQLNNVNNNNTFPTNNKKVINNNNTSATNNTNVINDNQNDEINDEDEELVDDTIDDKKVPLINQVNDDNSIDESSLFSVEFRKIEHIKMRKQINEVQEPNSPTLSDGSIASSSMFITDVDPIQEQKSIENIQEQKETSPFTSEFEKASKNMRNENHFDKKFEQEGSNDSYQQKESNEQNTEFNDQLNDISESLFSVEFEKSKGKTINKNKNIPKEPKQEEKIEIPEVIQQDQSEISTMSESLFSVEFEKAKGKAINKQKPIKQKEEPVQIRSQVSFTNNDQIENTTCNSESLFSTEFDKSKGKTINKAKPIKQEEPAQIKKQVSFTNNDLTNNSESMFSVEFEKSKGKKINKNKNIPKETHNEQIIEQHQVQPDQFDLSNDSESMFSVEFEKSKGKTINKSKPTKQEELPVQIKKQVSFVNNDQIDTTHNSESLFSTEFEKSRGKKINKHKTPQKEEEQPQITKQVSFPNDLTGNSESLFSTEFEKSRGKKINKQSQQPIEQIKSKPSTNNKNSTIESDSMFSVEFEKSKNRPQPNSPKENESFSQQLHPRRSSQIKEAKSKEMSLINQEITDDSLFTDEMNNGSLYSSAMPSKRFIKVDQSESSDLIDSELSNIQNSKEIISTTQPINDSNKPIDQSFTSVKPNNDIKSTNYKPDKSKFIKQNQNESSDLISEISDGISLSSSFIKPTTQSKQKTADVEFSKEFENDANEEVSIHVLKLEQPHNGSSIISSITNGESSMAPKIVHNLPKQTKIDKNYSSMSDDDSEIEHKFAKPRNQMTSNDYISYISDGQSKNEDSGMVAVLPFTQSEPKPKKPKKQSKIEIEDLEDPSSEIVVLPSPVKNQIQQTTIPKKDQQLQNSKKNEKIQPNLNTREISKNDQLNSTSKEIKMDNKLTTKDTKKNDQRPQNSPLRDIKKNATPNLNTKEISKNDQNSTPKETKKVSVDLNSTKTEEIRPNFGNKNENKQNKNRNLQRRLPNEESDDDNLGEYDCDIGESSSCFSFGLKKLPSVKPNPSISSILMDDLEIEQKNNETVDPSALVPFPADENIKNNHIGVTFDEETTKHQNTSKELNSNSIKHNSDLSPVSSEFAFTPKATPTKVENNNLGATFESIEEADDSLISEIPTSSKPSPDNHQIRNNISTSAFIDSSFDEEEEEEISIIPKTTGNTSSDRANIILEDLELFDNEEEEQNLLNEAVVDIGDNQNIQENNEENDDEDYEVNDDEIGGFENFLKNSPPIYKNKNNPPPSDFSSSQINGDHAFGTVKTNDKGNSGEIEGVIQVDSSFEF